jgi:type VI secretion system secreted protein VgrG
MSVLTQTERPMRVETVLGANTLALSGFRGQEGISALFSFELDLYSDDSSIKGEDLLRTSASIFLKMANGEEREINGVIRRFVQGGCVGDITGYHVEIVPWFWFLQLSHNVRMFQKKSVPDIIEAVFKAAGYSDFELRLNATYKPREYCVQYRETDFNFVSRLMEEEGIFYFFEHADGKHVMVLADTNGKVPACPIPSARVHAQPLMSEDVIHTIQHDQAVHIGKVTLAEYDYLQPSLTLRSSSDGSGVEEVYDYLAVGYTTLEAGERYARIRLEAEEVQQKTVRGVGRCRSFISGHKFDLKDHYRADFNTTYMLLQVRHIAKLGDYTSGGDDFEYDNEFLAIPHAVVYRPPLTTEKPKTYGTQSAIVVGPKGEEIYTDSHGRIKVQFHWDRDGKKDENSSCWVRVASPYAGKGWGNVTIPRIGNEVLVEFLEGDPDRPYVVGSVYNADQTPPFALPGAGIQMGVKSRSSKGGGGYNEITVTDTKGKEQITIHGQYDMNTTVENDQNNTINNNRTTKIAVDDTENVGSNQTIDIGADQKTTVGGNQDLKVSGNRTAAVDGNETITVSGNQKVGVDGNQDVTIGGNRTIDVSSNDTIEAGSNMKHGAGANFELAAGGNLTADATGDMKLSGMKVDVAGQTTITLTAGGSSIEIGPAGIKITTGAMVTVMGATIKLN